MKNFCTVTDKYNLYRMLFLNIQIETLRIECVSLLTAFKQINNFSIML